MFARFSTSTVFMEVLSEQRTIEHEEHPPSFQVLFGEPNASDNIQCQSQSIVLTSNDQCRQLFVRVQSTPDQSICNIKSYIAWSVLNIIFCCCCCGFVAFCVSVETRVLKKQGNIQGAVQASKKSSNVEYIHNNIWFYHDYYILMNK
jgi:hypothetical protein